MENRLWLSIVAGLLMTGGLLVNIASAYIDPGTGSYVLQIAIAFLVGLAFTLKVFWKRISAFFRKTFSGKKNSGHDAS